MKKMTYLLVGIMLLASLLIMACGSPATTSVPPSPAPKVSSPAVATPTSPAPAAPSAPAPASTAQTKPSASAADAGKYGGIIKISLANGPSTPLGYMPEAAPDSYTYSKPALEGLIRVKMSGEALPVLATSWDIAPAANTMTFHLRKGVKFHDGSDFNASVVKWNFELMMAAKKAPNFVSIDAVDDYTVRINLKTFQNTDFTGLSSGAFNIISKASFDKNGIEYTRSHPIGTGPFKFVEYVRDSKLSYAKNPDYWDTGRPFLDGVVYSVVTESTVSKLMFTRGDLSLLFAAGINAQELQKSGAIMKTQPGGCFGLVPDSANANSPFAKLAVRQAMSYALDRQALADGLGFGFLKPAYQMYDGYAVTAVPGLQKTPFDTAKAKQLLKDAGYASGFKTSIHVNPGVFTADMAAATAKMLTDVGIQTDVDSVTSGKYQEYRTQGWTNSLLAQGFLNMDNFNSTLNLYFPATNIMMPSLKKPDGFNNAVTASLASPQVDPAKLQAVFKLMSDDMTVIPFASQVQAQFYNKGVNDPGADDYAFVNLQYKDVWLDAIAR